MLPVTSVLKKLYLPTHVLLPAGDSGLRTDSMVLAEQPVCLAKERLEDYISTLPAALLQEVAAAHLLSTSAIALLDTDRLLALCQEARSLSASSVETQISIPGSPSNSHPGESSASSCGSAAGSAGTSGCAGGSTGTT